MHTLETIGQPRLARARLSKHINFAAGFHAFASSRIVPVALAVGLLATTAAPSRAASPSDDLTPKLDATFRYANRQIARWVEAQSATRPTVSPLQKVSDADATPVVPEPQSRSVRKDALAVLIAVAMPLRLLVCGIGCGL